MGFNGGNPPVPGQQPRQQGGPGGNRPAGPGQPSGAAAAAAAGAATPRPQVPGVDRQFQLNELVAGQGGFTPLLFAARDGFMESAVALLDAGADVNQVAESDKNSPLLTALINGHFDLARLLVERGADVNWAADNGVTPLYAVLNVQWAPKALYPQPQAYRQQKLTYLDMMKVLLDKGADVNARLQEEGVVLGLQLRPLRRGRDWRHAVLARGLRQRRRRDEAAGVLRRRPQHPDHEAGGAPASR